MSIKLRVVLTAMCAAFAVVGLVTLNGTLAGVGAGLGIALIAATVESLTSARRQR